jgi:cyclohexadienyl dehydratase
MLRVGMSGDYKPFSFRNPAGAWSGFDVEMAQRFASDTNRAVELVPFQWPDLLAQLRAGAFDIAMSGVTVRADRALQAAFSRPYATTGAVAVVRRTDRERLRALVLLDRETVRIAVNRGGHLEQIARERFPHAQLTTVADNAALPDLLSRGAVDAVISEQLEARTWPPEAVVILSPFTHDRKAYAVRREDAGLLRQVNDWLAAREADGWLNTQRRRWLGESAVITAEQACFEALVADIDLRLHLMPFVAAIKRRDHLPIEDPAQEARVIERVRTSGVAAGVNADDVAAVFRVQMEAAKAIEHQAASIATPSESLDDARGAVATASDQVIAELARCQHWLGAAGARAELVNSVQDGLTVPGMSVSVAANLVEAIEHLRAIDSSGR